MYIKDVCSKCKLTKKAVEYYEQQGLIYPKVLENGYRIYSEEDINKLKEIGALRKIGISIADIKDILESNNKSAALSKCKYKMNLEFEKSIAKKKCLEQLIKDYNIDNALKYIEENIDKFFTIKEKLLQSFPGWYGMYLSIHFGQFLNGKIDTEEKENAYKKIVEYLDKIEGIQLPDELEEYLLQSTEYLEDVDMQKINNIILDAVNNTEEYLKQNKEDIEKYLEFKNSDEYKNSIAYKMQQLLLKFQQESGYYDIFIKNLKILSDSYREYFEKLQAANKIFLDKYPQIDNTYNRL
ncbi:transcriptional regulator, MerR family [Caloramator quimbayensis]|uniref:Transcriptional regulator, MerR family n=1 Tax=Caloramator quimbayensis TaxID=1147123 RepID=A0A1T4WQW2_9CLOT|nr:MerR family transcriptional regulator [Caloramator quimbayensis]SKA79248.1 transcriptional regulator, MerR family [Caloramator quimbayensis]